MINRVLLVDDDASVRDALGQSLGLQNLRATLAGSLLAAKDHITRDFEGVIVSDIRMPGKDGFALLEYAQLIDSELPVILLTGEGGIPMAVRGISAGAFGFLEKPCEPKDLFAVIDKALKTRALVLENRRLRRQLETGDAASRMLIGDSMRAEELRNHARAVAKASADVLITGEQGSGTSKVAEVIHLLSSASMRPFQKIAAASLTPETLSQAFDLASGGTLFLDEVVALSPVTQFALLERMEIGARARVIAGTYRNIQSDVKTGAFNPDLFYKLDVMNIRIPSLKERRDDIPVLFRHYVDIACEQAALAKPEIGPEVVAGLMAQEWPGNARALMNAAMRFSMGLNELGSGKVRDLGLSEQMAHVERSFLSAALQRNNGNASEAARELKLPRKTFYDKLARHGIKADIFRK